MRQSVFISGATGYLGSVLTADLVFAGCDVYALTRPKSIRKLPIGCTPVVGDALQADTFLGAIPAGATFVHLTGVAHPSPAKADAFRKIDQVSFEASLSAALSVRSQHFIYVSVAQPAPIMQAYIAVRQECEARLTRSGLPATILRPWYILGPGHRWPIMLKPIYKLASFIPAWRETALRLGLVTREQMRAALCQSVLNAPNGIVHLGVDAIRGARLESIWAAPVPSPQPLPPPLRSGARSEGTSN